MFKKPERERDKVLRELLQEFRKLNDTLQDILQVLKNQNPPTPPQQRFGKIVLGTPISQ